MSRFSSWKHRYTFIILVYVAAWLAIFMGFSFLGWPGPLRKCVTHQTCFCEWVDLNTLWGQPVSSLTNFAYVVSGIAIVLYLTRDGGSTGLPASGLHGNFKHITTYSFLYAMLVVNVGLGSLFMHASQRLWTGTLDVFAMNMFIVYVLVYSISQILKLPVKRFLILYAAIEVGMLVYYLLDLLDNMNLVKLKMIKPNLVFGMLVAATTAWEVAFQIACRRRALPGRRDWKYLLLSVVLFVSGFIVWEMEDMGFITCDPFSPLQAHGIWHVVTAVATFTIFLYLNGETTGHPGAVNRAKEVP